MADHEDGTRRRRPAPDDPFVALRREMRRQDARWYWGCRARSSLSRLLHAMQYANIYAIHPVVPSCERRPLTPPPSSA